MFEPIASSSTCETQMSRITVTVSERWECCRQQLWFVCHLEQIISHLLAVRSDPKGLLLLLQVSACRSFSCSQVLSALYYDFNLLLSTPCHAPPVSPCLLLVSVTHPAFLLVCSYCCPLCKDAIEVGLGLWKGFLFADDCCLHTILYLKRHT